MKNKITETRDKIAILVVNIVLPILVISVAVSSTFGTFHEYLTAFDGGIISTMAYTIGAYITFRAIEFAIKLIIKQVVNDFKELIEIIKTKRKEETHDDNIDN